MFVLVVGLDYQSLFSGTGPRKRRKSSLVGWPHEKTYYEKLHGQLIPILYFADPVCWPSKWFNDQGLISVSNYISPKMWLKMCRLQLTWTFLTGEFFNYLPSWAQKTLLSGKSTLLKELTPRLNKFYYINRPQDWRMQIVVSGNSGILRKTQMTRPM